MKRTLTIEDVARIRGRNYPDDRELFYRALAKYISGLRRGDEPTPDEIDYAFEAAISEDRLVTAEVILNNC